jgi:protein TonB
MEARKNPEAELEGRKTTFWLLGMLLALGLTLVAFEWTAFERTVGEMAALDMDLLEEEVIPPSAAPRGAAPPPPPPPPTPPTRPPPGLSGPPPSPAASRARGSRTA